MPRDGANIYTQPFPDVASDTTIESVVYNGFTSDVANDLNAPRPILAGGTGGATADAALTNLSAEKSLQVVTNYNSMVWMPGSFYSASSATGAPVAGHAFVGLVYLADSNNIVLEARDQNDSAVPGRKYVREKKSGVWSVWKSDSLTLTGTSEGVSGDTADMFFGLTGTAPSSAFIVNTESDISGINALEVSKAGNMIVRDTSGNGTVILNKLSGATGRTNEIYGQTNDVSRWRISLGDTVSEGGGNAGSNFHIYSYTDAGATLHVPLAINRATGLGTVAGNPTDPLGIATKQYVDGIYNADVALTEVQKAQARENVYAAPFDALAFNGMQVNGGVDADQLSTGTALALITGNVRGPECWIATKTALWAGTVGRVLDGPLGYNYSLKVTISTGSASPAGIDALYVQHTVEGHRISRLAWGTASAQPLVIGFWTNTQRAGTYSGCVRNNAGNRSYPFSFTCTAGTWEWQTASIPGDTSGTWERLTSVGLNIVIVIAAGATMLGTANAWTASNHIGVTGSINGAQTSADSFQVTGLVVLPGTEVPSSARAVYLQRPYDSELMLCRRYFRPYHGGGTGFCDGATIVSTSIQLDPPMRVVPSVTATAQLQTVANAASGTNNPSSAAVSSVAMALTSASWRFLNYSGLTSGQAVSLIAQTNMSAYFDARM